MKEVILMKKTILTGLRPTGNLHLGHYFGASQNWVKLQDEYDCYFSVADWHALTTKYDKKNNPMYHVAYEGMVIAGIEFDDIKIDVKENEKKIIITIPEIKIQDVKVNESTLDYMFLKNKYETETIAQEAYKLCIEDLKARITEENILYDTAKTNAKFSLEAMFKPWIETIDDTYTVEIK